MASFLIMVLKINSLANPRSTKSQPETLLRASALQCCPSPVAPIHNCVLARLACPDRFRFRVEGLGLCPQEPSYCGSLINKHWVLIEILLSTMKNLIRIHIMDPEILFWGYGARVS